MSLVVKNLEVRPQLNQIMETAVKGIGADEQTY